MIANRFRLDHLLGEGGMGVVYRATDLQRNEECALKFLTNQRGALDITRFKREFRSAARLNHPNCVRAFELGHDNAHWFFTMEYVKGQSLLRTKWTNTDAVVDMGLQMLAALDHVHARQIVHRDIKPQNILVSGEQNGPQRFKLSDLGIAKQAGHDDAVAVGQLVGSLRYISPEQARGEPVDPRSDLYSLGMVLYELIAGRPPFIPETNDGGSAWLWLHRDYPPTPLCDLAFEASPMLERVVMRLLEKDPALRYPMAAAAFDDLKRCISRDSTYPFAQLPPLERPSYLSAPRFVGRKAELNTLSDFVTQGLDGRSAKPQRALFISGDAGVGKSRIASQLLKLAESNNAHLMVCTCRAEPGAAYEPLASLMDYLWRRAPSKTSENTTRVAPSGSITHAMASADTPTVAETVSLPKGQPVAGYDDREGQQWRFQRRVADQVLAVCSQRRHILLLEDAQWADAPTLALLGFILRAVTTTHRERNRVPWVVVITHRPSPASVPLEELKELCTEYDGFVDMRLKALEPDAATELVASMLSVPVDEEVRRLTRALLARAEGNPLFLGQILYALVAGKHLQRQGSDWNLSEVRLESVLLPSTVRSAVGDRAARCSVWAQETFAAAAVIGRQFNLDVLQGVLKVEQPVVLDSIDELIRAGFIEELGEAQFRFVHDRFREAITEQLNADESRRLHLRVAEELERLPRTTHGVTADLAHHFAQAQKPLKAYRYSVLAGDEAMRAYAFTKASDLYQAALTISARQKPRPSKRLLQRHAEASLQAGRFAAAAHSYGQRLEMLEDPIAKAENLRQLADVEYRKGNTEQAGRLLEDVLRLLGFRVPSNGFQLWSGVFRYTLVFLLRLWLPHWVLTRTKTEDRASLGIIARVCSQLTEHFYFGDFFRAAFYQLSGLATAERVGPGRELSVATAQQGFLFGSYGFRGLAFRFLDRAQRYAKLATPLEQAWEEMMRGMVHGFLGDAHANMEAQLRGERLLGLCPETLRLRQTWFQRADALLVAGDFTKVQGLATQVMELATDLKDERSRGWGLLLQGMLDFRLGKGEGALTMLEQAADTCQRGGDLNYELVAASRHGFALACHGKLEQAVAVTLDAAQAFNNKNLRNPTAAVDGAFLAAAGLLYLRDGRWSPSIARAVRHYERWGFFNAYCFKYSTPLYEAGRAVCSFARGKDQQGSQHLSRAIAHCEQHLLWGELLDVHRLAALVFQKKQPELAHHHTQQAEALLARLKQPSTVATGALAA